MLLKLSSNHALVLIMLVLFQSTALATEVSAKMISYTCSGCHGTDGLLVKPGLPKLKAQPADELEKKLLDFKYDKRPSSVMGRIAKGYTDTELKSVAQYFSGLE